MRQAAKDAGVPIYAVKTCSPSNLLRALRTLLGIDPSAGGTFARRQDEDEEDSFQSDALAAAAAGTAFVRDTRPPVSSQPAIHGNVVSRVRCVGCDHYICESHPTAEGRSRGCLCRCASTDRLIGAVGRRREPERGPGGGPSCR